MKNRSTDKVISTANEMSCAEIQSLSSAELARLTIKASRFLSAPLYEHITHCEACATLVLEAQRVWIDVNSKEHPTEQELERMKAVLRAHITA